ncbi:hypothetical protein BGZ46_003643 [Entomortierella lignicola]|nr:hypothetical protein BGZ46_003643 [Entomortierella lignicola]KAF9200662.1 hypothetical protein BGZ49_009097 [Haplosporangium sp. Z 27]
MKATPQETVHEAVQLLKEGYSTRQAAEILKISAATVSRILANNKDELPPDHKVNKGGRPRKIPASALDSMRDNIDHGLITSLDQAKDEFDRVVQGNVSMTTVRRRLKEAGLEVKK